MRLVIMHEAVGIVEDATAVRPDAAFSGGPAVTAMNPAIPAIGHAWQDLIFEGIIQFFGYVQSLGMILKYVFVFIQSTFT